MTFSRRTFGRLVLGSTISAAAERLLAQGVATHTAKPLSRPLPSGRPFNAHFVDVAASAGLTSPAIYGGIDSKKYILEATGCGCAFIDYDNDGWMDIFILSGTRLEGAPSGASNRLYKNNRDGTFTDVTEKAGLTAVGWASAVCVGDYNNDGFEDLFCTYFGQNHLYRNNGDGTFTDVSKAAGIAAYRGKAWGVVASDINNDGNLDLFVANDTVANFLFVNRGGKFEQIGEPAGVAYSAEGRPRSGMGVDSADYDQDGWMDLFVANIDREIYSIYQNNHDETFDDRARETGVGVATRLMSGWGLKFFDYDNDGNLDLFLANGNPDDLIESLHPGVTYKEPPILMHNTGRGFENVSAQSGPIFGIPISARGTAIGDFDNDGAVDVLIAVNGGPPVLLRNNVGKQNHWLGLSLAGKKSNPDAIGARVTYQAGDLKRSHMKVGGGSYLSSHDPRMVLGLGQRKKVDWLEVKWPQPSTRVDRFGDLPVDRYIAIVEGQERWK